MEKYEEIKQNLYVTEVGKLTTLFDVSKLLGVSSKQLRKYVIEEQIRNNNLLVDMLNAVFKYNVLPENQSAFYLGMLEQKTNIEYASAVIDNAHPNMKNNPVLFIKTLVSYTRNQIKELDDINLKLVERKENVLADYVSQFASDYGISSKRFYNYILEMQKKNHSLFQKITNLYNMTHADKKEDSLSDKIRKIPNLEYLVAALIYNFPGMVTTSDSFFNAVTSQARNDIEKVDNEEIDDQRIQRFLNAKKEYLFAGSTK